MWLAAVGLLAASVFSGERVEFAFQVVDEHAVPVAHASVDVDVFWRVPKHARTLDALDPGWTFGDAVATDAEGRTSVAFDEHYGLAGFEPLLVLTFDRNEPACRSSLIDPMTEWRVGRHELGALTLRPAPTLLAGHVFDSNDRGLAGVRVSVPDGGMHGLESTTNEDGAFRIASAAPFRSVFVFAQREGFVSQGHETAVGSTGVRLVAYREARVRARLRAPEGARPGSFALELRKGDVSLLGPHEPLEAFEHVFTRCEPGSYRLSAYAVDEALELATVGRFEVLEGELHDLGEIDLSRIARILALRVIDEHGEPVRAGRYRLLRDEPREFARMWDDAPYKSFADGEIRAMACAEHVAALVVADGKRITFVPDVRERDVVTLRPGIRVRLEPIDAGAAERDGSRFTFALLGPPRAERPWFRAYVHPESSAFDANGRAELIAPCPGTFLTDWRSSRDGATKSWPGEPLEIPDSTEPVVLRLAPPIEPSTGARVK